MEKGNLKSEEFVNFLKSTSARGKDASMVFNLLNSIDVDVLLKDDRLSFYDRKSKKRLYVGVKFQTKRSFITIDKFLNNFIFDLTNNKIKKNIFFVTEIKDNKMLINSVFLIEDNKRYIMRFIDDYHISFELYEINSKTRVSSVVVKDKWIRADDEILCNSYVYWINDSLPLNEVNYDEMNRIINEHKYLPLFLEYYSFEHLALMELYQAFLSDSEAFKINSTSNPKMVRTL